MLPPSLWVYGLAEATLGPRSKCLLDITGHILLVQILPKWWCKSLPRKGSGTTGNGGFHFGRTLLCEEWFVSHSCVPGISECGNLAEVCGLFFCLKRPSLVPQGSMHWEFCLFLQRTWSWPPPERSQEQHNSTALKIWQIIWKQQKAWK